MGRAIEPSGERVDRQELILEAALRLLSRHGISGVSIRAVAREANVALGLMHYYFEDKAALIAAALRRVEEQDVAIVEPDPTLDPEASVRAALHRVADPEFLTTEYLSDSSCGRSLKPTRHSQASTRGRRTATAPVSPHSSAPRDLIYRRLNATDGQPTSTSSRTDCGSRRSSGWTERRSGGLSSAARRSPSATFDRSFSRA